MESRIIEYLSKHIKVSDTLKKIIHESALIKFYPKGTVLLRQGDLIKESYLVLEGCIKSYILKDGNEKIIEFYTENQAVMTVITTNRISDLYLECIEDTLVGISNEELETDMMEKYPELEAVCRTMSEIMLNQQQQEYMQFKTNTPEERYKELQQNRPTLLQRLPQHQIASYLGIKPESLSRIRNRLTKKTSANLKS